ncbi:MAG: DUF1559 domain-containing protein [Victivallales bacterium]|nr:DUF1559 domain-containing protein [Victivallales bacterium]
MLLPALGKARNKARTISCTNCIKQVGLGFAMYASDYSDYLPYEASSWYQYACRYYVKSDSKYRTFGVLAGDNYIPVSVLSCVGAPFRSGYYKNFKVRTESIYSGYSMRDNIGHMGTKAFLRLNNGNSTNAILADCFSQLNYIGSYPSAVTRLDPYGNRFSAWHDTFFNVLFFDGHAQTVAYHAAMLKSNGSAPLYNDYPVRFWNHVGSIVGEQLK